MRNIFAVLILVILISGCSGTNPTKQKSIPMLYNFNEPFKFPFDVNEVRTEIAIDNPDVLQQFIFYYKNKQTSQEIKYILSKVIDKPEQVSVQGKLLLELKNGKQAYYNEDETSQAIWWESENGFLARLIYYGNVKLNNNKLDESVLIDLANQIQ